MKKACLLAAMIFLAYSSGLAQQAASKLQTPNKPQNSKYLHSPSASPKEVAEPEEIPAARESRFYNPKVQVMPEPAPTIVKPKQPTAPRLPNNANQVPTFQIPDRQSRQIP